MMRRKSPWELNHAEIVEKVLGQGTPALDVWLSCMDFVASASDLRSLANLVGVLIVFMKLVRKRRNQRVKPIHPN
jgi:hypothetical protein